MCELPNASEALCQVQKPNKLRQGFISLAETLLSSIADVFPECENTEMALHMFRTVLKGNDCIEDQFIRRCQALFKQHSTGLKNHDVETLFTLLESLDQLRDIDMRDKWDDPDFAPESRDHLWQYVAALKTYADLYTAVPKNVMGKIESVAGCIGEQLSRGELDLRSMDLGKIGQTLLADLSSEELEGFEGKLPDIYESLSEVANAIGGGCAGIDMSALMEQLASQSGENGPTAAAALNGVDLTKVLQQLSSGMQPGNNKAAPLDAEALLRAMAPMLQAVKAAPPAALLTLEVTRRGEDGAMLPPRNRGAGKRRAR